MKITLVAVCALIAVDPAFADDKRTLSPRAADAQAAVKIHKAAKPARVVQVASAATPVPVAKAAPPKPHPWVGLNVTISDSERDAIRAYVRTRLDASKGGKFNGVPQGLAKKVSWFNTLPSGWRETCVRGAVLSREVHEHCQPLPHDVVVKLPPPPPGTVLLAVDGRVLRVAYPTYEILDAFNVL